MKKYLVLLTVVLSLLMVQTAAADTMLYTYTGPNWTTSFGAGFVPDAGPNLTIQFTYTGTLPATLTDVTATTPFTVTSGAITLNSWQHSSPGNTFIHIEATGGSSIPTGWDFAINDVGGGTGYTMAASYPVSINPSYALTELSDYTANKGTYQSASYTYPPGIGTWTATAVPLPPSVLLLGSGLLGLAALGRRKFRKS